MRLFKTFLFCCLLTIAVFAQKSIVPLQGTESREILKLKSQANVGGVTEQIITTKFLDDESKLLVLSTYGVKIWNVKTNELLRSVSHEITDIDKINVGTAIDPEGTKTIVFETFEYSLKKFFRKKKVSATVYDLETGVKIAVLERPKESIRRAVWTKDGRTLITFSNDDVYDSKTEICFWDGQSLEFRGSLTTNKGIYLTADGDRFITVSQITQNTLGYKSEYKNPVNIWSLRTLKVEKEFSLSPIKSLGYTTITPDEKFLITKNDKQIVLLNLENGDQKTFSTNEKESIDSFQLTADKKYLFGGKDNSVFIWEVAGDGTPKFEVATRQPVDKYHFTASFAGFSEGGEYAVVSQNKYKKALGFLAYDLSEDFEYYDLKTGKIEPNLNTYFTESDSVFSADRDFGISTTCETATVYNNKTQQQLFKFPLECKTYTSTTTNTKGETETNTYSYNDDIIVFHPKKNISLVAKDDVLEVYGVDPDERQLQKIFTPKDLDKNSFRKQSSTSRLSYVDSKNADSNVSISNLSSAGFLLDGRYVYAISKDKKSVIFWEVNENMID